MTNGHDRLHHGAPAPSLCKLAQDRRLDPVNPGGIAPLLPDRFERRHERPVTDHHAQREAQVAVCGDRLAQFAAYPAPGARHGGSTVAVRQGADGRALAHETGVCVDPGGGTRPFGEDAVEGDHVEVAAPLLDPGGGLVVDLQAVCALPHMDVGDEQQRCLFLHAISPPQTP
ncbi:hypothetical protein [Novosphingobium sp. 9U]|uniref:hypothetical protein n=1 Tax=Novosphingobium sp. 9U TaxID=2653158 RepID=UPI00135BA455|nr:hypothetical protein [Novosphingobium sp. 9U]